MFPVSSAFNQLLLLLRPGLDAVGLRHALAAVPDWRAVVETGRARGLLPLLAHVTGLAGAMDAVPADVWSALLGAAYRQAERAEAAAELLAGVLARLTKAGLPALSIKGMVTSLRAYGSPSVRPFADLDILVEPARRREACDALRDLGFISAFPRVARAEFFDSSTDYVMGRAGATHGVDLCRGFDQHYFRLDLPFPQLFDRSVTVDLAGVSVRALSPADEFLHLCYHGTKHAWSNPVWLLDVAWIAAHPSPGFEWTALAGDAERAGAAIPTALGLLLVSDLLKGALPSEVLGWACRHPQAMRLAEDVRRRFGEPVGACGSAEETRFEWRATRPGWPRVRYAAGLLLGPTMRDYRWRPLPPSLYFLYHVLRPLRLVMQRLRMHPSAGDRGQETGDR